MAVRPRRRVAAAPVRAKAMTGDPSPYSHIRTPDPHRQQEQAQVQNTGMGWLTGLVLAAIFGWLAVVGLVASVNKVWGWFAQ